MLAKYVMKLWLVSRWHRQQMEYPSMTHKSYVQMLEDPDALHARHAGHRHPLSSSPVSVQIPAKACASLCFGSCSIHTTLNYPLSRYCAPSSAHPS